MEDQGFSTMEEYTQRCQNAVAQYIASRSVLDLCEGPERAPEVWVWIRWWEQAGINLEGTREEAVAAVERDGGEEWQRVSKEGLSVRINRSDYT